ncbi:MAG: ABC transporter ATP-binding protein [Sulfuricella denitrificans]|nr:ABC transporter ATP-binding protein [Sulfuricella denitrificans]
MSTPALHFEQLSKAYGKSMVLNGLNLDVHPGEFFGLVGVNGAGKTTLIKCLMDFSESDKGRIEIFGISNREHRARAQLAFVPEHFSPPYYLTGRDFFRYMFRLRGQTYQPVLIETMLQRLDLDLAVLTKPVRAYSKGMTQKIGLAASFLSERALYVLDEPMSGLDPKARALLKSQLRSMKTQGRTLFFSSHALSDVEEICDRMAILHQGSLRFVGTPSECCQQYAAASLEQAFMNCIA